MLAGGGLEILSYRGVRVPLVTKDRFREVIEIRLALERLAVEQAAKRITTAELMAVEELHEYLSNGMSCHGG